MRIATLSLFALSSLVLTSAQISPKVIGSSFERWLTEGAPDVFVPDGADVRVNWDSSKPNSYYYLPLGFTISPDEDFKVTLVFEVDSLTLGTTPGKPDTFEIGAGLINLTNALDPQFFRGAGIDAAHGARNLIEFDYFPPSGFITATIAPTVATRDNQILYSHNFPMPLEAGAVYKVEMAFTAWDRTLRSTLWSSDDPGSFPGPGTPLKPIVLTAGYSDFVVDTIALCNYNDQGQNPPQFSGSLQGTGLFKRAEVTFYDRPALAIEETNATLVVTFETSEGWLYQLEEREGTGPWKTIGPAFAGTGQRITQSLTPPRSSAGSSLITLYRVRAIRT